MPQQADGWQPDLTYSIDQGHFSRLSSRLRAGRRWLGLGREALPLDADLARTDLPRTDLRPTDLAGTDRVSTNSVRVGSIDAGSEFPAEADVFPGWLPWLETCTSDRLSVKPDVAVNKGALGLDSEDSRGPSERHQFPQIFDASHRHQPEVNTLSGLIHDTRNMVTTIGLYCDLLEEPGVLSAPFGHYAGELRMVADNSRRLIDRLAGLASSGAAPRISIGNVAGDATENVIGDATRDGTDEHPPGPHLLRRDLSNASGTLNASGSQGAASRPAGDKAASLGGEALAIERTVGSAPLRRGARAKSFETAHPVKSLADELMVNHRLLSALCGPAITLGLAIEGGNRPLPITADDLTRVLVNLVKNAADAMPTGGHIQVDLEESLGSLSLSVADNGPGIAERALESIFTAGYTTHLSLYPELDLENSAGSETWPTPHRGMGLAIVRSIVTAAGGYVWAANRHSNDPFHHPSLPAPGEPIPAKQTETGAILFLDFPIPASSEPDFADS